MTTDDFRLEMAVRDYECDLQGVVNNAVYQNYLEHARHEYLKTLQVDFAALAAQGIHLVVTRVEIDYKTSLTSGETFVVAVQMERASPLRLTFLQTIYRQPDQRVIIKALVTGTALGANGRPQLPPELAAYLTTGAAGKEKEGRKDPRP